MSNPYFKTQGDDIVVTCPYLECYIPVEYFNMGIAVEYGGDCLEVLGLFNARPFKDSEGKQPYPKLETVAQPTTIRVYPTTFETKEMKLVPDVESDQYAVLKFYEGDIFTKVFFIQSAKNSESFLKILESGKLPPTIPYSKVFDIWTKNMYMNGVKMPDVPAANREMIISEIYRDAANPSRPFATRIGKDPKTSEYAYITANSRAICKYNSTFAGLTFEDFDTMVTNGLNINKSGRTESESPIEKIIKY